MTFNRRNKLVDGLGREFSHNVGQIGKNASFYHILDKYAPRTGTTMADVYKGQEPEMILRIVPENRPISFISKIAANKMKQELNLANQPPPPYLPPISIIPIPKFLQQPRIYPIILRNKLPESGQPGALSFKINNQSVKEQEQQSETDTEIQQNLPVLKPIQSKSVVKAMKMIKNQIDQISQNEVDKNNVALQQFDEKRKIMEGVHRAQKENKEKVDEQMKYIIDEINSIDQKEKADRQLYQEMLSKSTQYKSIIQENSTRRENNKFIHKQIYQIEEELQLVGIKQQERLKVCEADFYKWLEQKWKPSRQSSSSFTQQSHSSIFFIDPFKDMNNDQILEQIFKTQCAIDRNSYLLNLISKYIEYKFVKLYQFTRFHRCELKLRDQIKQDILLERSKQFHQQFNKNIEVSDVEYQDDDNVSNIEYQNDDDVSNFEHYDDDSSNSEYQDDDDQSNLDNDDNDSNREFIQKNKKDQKNAIKFDIDTNLFYIDDIIIQKSHIINGELISKLIFTIEEINIYLNKAIEYLKYKFLFKERQMNQNEKFVDQEILLLVEQLLNGIRNLQFKNESMKNKIILRIQEILPEINHQLGGPIVQRILLALTYIHRQATTFEKRKEQLQYDPTHSTRKGNNNHLQSQILDNEEFTQSDDKYNKIEKQLLFANLKYGERINICKADFYKWLEQKWKPSRQSSSSFSQMSHSSTIFIDPFKDMNNDQILEQIFKTKCTIGSNSYIKTIIKNSSSQISQKLNQHIVFRRCELKLKEKIKQDILIERGKQFHQQFKNKIDTTNIEYQDDDSSNSEYLDNDDQSNLDNDDINSNGEFTQKSQDEYQNIFQQANETSALRTEQIIIQRSHFIIHELISKCTFTLEEINIYLNKAIQYLKYKFLYKERQMNLNEKFVDQEILLLVEQLLNGIRNLQFKNESMKNKIILRIQEILPEINHQLGGPIVQRILLALTYIHRQATTFEKRKEQLQYAPTHSTRKGTNNHFQSQILDNEELSLSDDSNNEIISNNLSKRKRETTPEELNENNESGKRPKMDD